MFDGLAAAALRAVGREVGALSPMADAYGVYADPVRRSVIALPDGWEERLVDLEGKNGEIIASCIDPVGASIAKLVAGRSKDIEFVTALLERDLVDCAMLASRSDLLDRRLKSLAKAFDELVSRLGESVDERSLALLRDAAKRLMARAAAEP